MRRIFMMICFVVVICSSVFLSGCFGKKEVVPVISVYDCLNRENYPKSEKGEAITYYFATDNEVTIFWSDSWRRGYVSCRKYFLNKDTYELEKGAQKWDKSIDNELMLFKKEYLSISDMDAHWDSVESSGIYTIYR